MIFSSIPKASADPILGLTEAYLADPREQKVNLGVGIYKDDNGQTPILASVKRAEQLLIETEKSKSYLAIQGIENYNQGLLALLFSQHHRVLVENRAKAAQAPGGTGALRVAAEFIVRNTDSRTIWVSAPTWANHHSIFSAAGLNIQEYDYYQPETHDLNFELMCSDLKRASKGDIVLLHGCCHNPTGVDLSEEQWFKLAELCLDKQLIPLVDFAYQGFGDGIEEDAQGLRILANCVPELLVASSFSKNFGLYNERVGAVTLVANNEENANKAFSQLKKVIRASYSNPPAHGALVVSSILANDELKQQWLAELAEMRQRIAEMRTLLVQKLKHYGVKQDFSFISKQKGMFSFSGLNQSQVEALKQNYGIYIVGSGRISVAGLTPDNIDYVAKAIAEVIEC